MSYQVLYQGAPEVAEFNLVAVLIYLPHCSWKPQMDGLKNAETSSMDFCTQLITLKGWMKQFENLWADF